MSQPHAAGSTNLSLVGHPCFCLMEFSKRVIGAGRWKGHLDYEPSIWPLGNGERCNLVAKVLIRDDLTDGGHWCQGVITGQRFRLVAPLPTEVGCPKVTILNAAKTYYRWPMLVIDKKAELLIHPTEDQARMTELVETCSGLGGIACGASYAGWTLHAQNDLNANFVKLQQQSSPVPIIEGDIDNMHTIIALHKAYPRAGTIAFGFACQPYSSAGDKREGLDPRALSLPYSLYAAHLLQKDIVVCECVPGAATSTYVLACLDYHMEMTSSDRSEVLLELADMWPSKRRRWWTVIVKQYIGKVPLQPLPKLGMDISISCLPPQFMTLDPAELQLLLLSPDERKGFASYGKGIGANVVDKNLPLPTALHSWGNQLIACSCGCRGPFSHERLSKHGLFGALIHVPGMPPDQNLRHIAPKEVALLTGFPRKDGWDAHPRLLLAGLGQVASPIQAAWIFAMIRQHLVDSKIIPGPHMSPKEILTCVTTDLFDLRDQWTPNNTSVSTQLFQESFDEWLLTKEPTSGQNTDPMTHDEMTTSQEEVLLTEVRKLETSCAGEKQGNPSHAGQAAPREENKDAGIHEGQTSPKVHGTSHALGKDTMPGVSSGSIPINAADAHVPLSPSRVVADHENAPHVNAMQPAISSQVAQSPSTEDAPEVNQGHPESHRFDMHEGSEVHKSSEFKLFHQSGTAPAFATDTAKAVSDFAVSPSLSHNSITNPAVMSPLTSPMWEASGAISAFATGSSKVSHTQQSGPKQPIGETQPTCHQLSPSPRELIEPGVLVYDADMHIISHQKCAHDATFAQWCQANEALGAQAQATWDLFGSSIAPDTLLTQLKWIITGSTPVFRGASDLATVTNLLVHMPRIESALLQGPAVASDEMMFYLTAISAVGLAKAKPPFILDGMTDLLVDAQIWIEGVDHINQFNAQQMVYSADKWMNFLPVQEATVTALWFKYHWIPVWLVPTDDGITVHTTFEGIQVWELLFPWWQTIIQVHDALPPSFDHDCGFRAFAWLVSQSTQTPLASLSVAEAWGWRHLFWQSLVTNPKPVIRFVLGGQSELETALQAILREHGVFASRLPERAAILIRSFPGQSLNAVFQSSRPWQALKQLASSHKPPIRLVLEGTTECHQVQG